MKQENPKRIFAVNQSIKLGEIPGTVEGYCSDGHSVLVRVYISNLTKDDERYLKQFNCLIPNAKFSRLYTITERELTRHNEQSKRKAVKDPKKRT